MVRRNPWFIFHCGWTLQERLAAFKHKLTGETHPDSVSPHLEKGGLNSENQLPDEESSLFSFVSTEGPLAPHMATIGQLTRPGEGRNCFPP